MSVLDLPWCVGFVFIALLECLVGVGEFWLRFVLGVAFGIDGWVGLMVGGFG